MITNDLIQGSAEWLAYRAQHFNASDAPAMMGCSAYKTRTQLLHEMHTGLVPEVDAATQRRFDDGHRFEALARPLAEEIIGQSLYPVTGSLGKLSASFDGLTMCETVALEHKTLNDELRTVLAEDNATLLPLQYRVQMEQQLMVSGAKECLFMASKWNGDELVEERHCWYECDPELRSAILQGWTQFAIDLESYVPAEVVQAAVAAPVMDLPAVFVNVTGELAVKDNLSLFEIAVKKYIADLPKQPSTDQEFADADAGCKAMQRAEDALGQVKAQTLGQVASVDTVVRTADLLADLCRTTRLSLEKLVKARKEQIRTEIVQKANAAFTEHIAALNTRLGKPYMPAVQADFAGVIKGKKTVESLQNAVDTEMAHAKIEANTIADKIQANLNTLIELASDCKHLFVDVAQIVLKAPEDLTALVKSRISDFKASEAKRLEAEREKMRVELAKEAADAEAAQVAKVAADKLGADRLEAAAVADAAPNTPVVEAKPEPVATVVVETATVAPTMRATVGYVTPAKLIAAIPVQTTTTRAEIIAILDTLNERDMVRTLHFMQYTFAKQAA